MWDTANLDHNVANKVNDIEIAELIFIIFCWRWAEQILMLCSKEGFEYNS